ncbi:MAG: hypothetical protein JKX73_06910 [Flavobacteriales bacterium]|nr:hypothetical protein [Flavobacteriales bacterium]
MLTQLYMPALGMLSWAEAFKESEEAKTNLRKRRVEALAIIRGVEE